MSTYRSVVRLAFFNSEGQEALAGWSMVASGE
jgi:hypothetical protein